MQGSAGQATQGVSATSPPLGSSLDGSTPKGEP
jgi:hypothetical protein